MGLFSNLMFARIANLSIENADVRGDYSVGILAATMRGGVVLHCTATGKVESPEGWVGGLIGSSSEGMIAYCGSATKVFGETAGGVIGSGYDVDVIGCYATGDTNGGERAGGLIGEAELCSVVSCSATGKVAIANVTGDPFWGDAGGLIGHASSTTVTTSYSTALVSGQFAGGLVGDVFSDLHLLHSHASGALRGAERSGGLAANGVGQSTATACFWDIDVSQAIVGLEHAPSPQDATGLPTGQMQKTETFTKKGWDFERTWTICEDDYPRLAWEQISCSDANDLAEGL